MLMMFPQYQLTIVVMVVHMLTNDKFTSVRIMSMFVMLLWMGTQDDLLGVRIVVMVQVVFGFGICQFFSNRIATLDGLQFSRGLVLFFQFFPCRVPTLYRLQFRRGLVLFVQFFPCRFPSLHGLELCGCFRLFCGRLIGFRGRF